MSEAEQEITISNGRRKWGKVVTLVNFSGDFDVNLDELITKAKKKCASGGTVRGNALELMGDHRFKLKKFLINQGFPEENIVIEE